MKLTRKRWIGLGLGIALFLAAFGIALAVTWVQVSRTVTGNLNLTGAIVLSSADLALWPDSTATGSQVTQVEITGVKTQAPLRQLQGTIRPVVYIENKSAHKLRPIDPYGWFQRSGSSILHINTQMYDMNGNYRGWTSYSSWPSDWVMAPGDVWKMELYPCCWSSNLSSGDHLFDLVFGAVGISGDSSSSPLSASGAPTSLTPAEADALYGGSREEDPPR